MVMSKSGQKRGLTSAAEQAGVSHLVAKHRLLYKFSHDMIDAAAASIS